jgi:hypothetical protein
MDSKSGKASAAWLPLSMLVASCGSPAQSVLSDASALEAQGKLEEAAARLEMGCALSPAAEPCPASDARAAETWQKAAEKAVTEGRYRDAERLLHRALLTADDAAKAAIAARMARDDLVQGLRYERSLGLADKSQIAGIFGDIAKHEAPAAAKAKEWLDKERPGILVAAVMSACGPEHEGSCTRAWSALQASGAKGPEVDKAQAAAEAEERRVYPLRVQAEGFLPVFVGRHRKRDEYAKCVATMAPGESMSPEGECFDRVWTGTAPEEKYDSDRNQDNQFRRTLMKIADPALVEELRARGAAAETTGKLVKQDIPKPPVRDGAASGPKPRAPSEPKSAPKK